MRHSKDVQFVVSIESADTVPSLEIEKCWQRISEKMTKITDENFDVDIHTLAEAGQARSGSGHTEEKLQIFREKVKAQAGVK